MCTTIRAYFVTYGHMHFKKWLFLKIGLLCLLKKSLLDILQSPLLQLQLSHKHTDMNMWLKVMTSETYSLYGRM